MAEYIERNKVLDICEKHYQHCLEMHDYCGDTTADNIKEDIEKLPAADVVPVVRCRDCKYAVELDKHCEINRASYRHCAMGRGDEEEYVWHKYKKYYKGYSIVELDDYCSYGERRCEDGKR
jgi:hypothetical protein